MVQLARELGPARSSARPSTPAGPVRSALTVLPVARGEAEADVGGAGPARDGPLAGAGGAGARASDGAAGGAHDEEWSGSG